MHEPTYKIIRFRRNGENEVRQTGLTLMEAQVWCSRDDTHDVKNGWFDGYTAEGEEDDA